MQDIITSKNFCALPFHHVVVRTNGNFNVCCNHKMNNQMNINTTTVEEWRNSDYINQVQQSFLQNQRHPGCASCWHTEDQGFTSLRQRMAKEFEILKIDVEQKSLTNVEIDLTNLCNLKCLMCSESESSAVLAENIRLGINRHSQKDFQWSEQALENLQELLACRPKVVNIRGGEPFYVKQLLKIIESIPENVARSMVLHITTNATVWTEHWQQALSKFKLVRFMFSVDAVGDLYEYMRFPGNWTMTSSNIDHILKLPNVKGLVHCVIQNLNVGGIGHLIDWCQQRSLWLDIALLNTPDYLYLTNLPKSYRDSAIKHLEHILEKYPQESFTAMIKNSLQMIKISEFDSETWQAFKTNIAMRDSLRGNSFERFFPDLLVT